MRTFAAACCLALAGCSLTQPASGSYSCDANGTCLDGFACNAQFLCVARLSGSSGAGSTSVGSSGHASTEATSTEATSSGSAASTGTPRGTTSTGAAGGASSTSRGGSSSGGSSGAALDFSGDWAMDWGSLSLAESGTAVSGTVHQWGTNWLGTIVGSASGDTFTGGFYWSNQNPNTTGVTFYLGDAGTSLVGSWGYGLYPWCGVRAGQPLFPGCGWSDTFTNTFDDATAGDAVLTQTSDEVTGTYPGGSLAGSVSEYRLNGVTLDGGTPTGKFSWWWETPGIVNGQGWTETAFQGNWLPASGPANPDWCGFRRGNALGPPATCFGGGGLYDGSWFTNLGVIGLTQAAGQVQGVGNVWYFWSGVPGDQFTIPPGSMLTASGLSWSGDGSPALGAVNLLAGFADGGLTLWGRTQTGDLWCGAQYFPTPYGGIGNPIGNLPPGCGLTNQWTAWQPGVSPASDTAYLIQTRGWIGGGTDGGPLFNGVVLANPTPGPTEALIYATGSWFDAPGPSGIFFWYPDSQDQSFSGDFTSGGADAGAWCGSIEGTLPSPCFQ